LSRQSIGLGRKTILKIAQIDPLLVEVALPLEAYGKLRVGMTGMVIPEGLKGRYSASITVVDSVFDAAKRNVWRAPGNEKSQSIDTWRHSLPGGFSGT